MLVINYSQIILSYFGVENYSDFKGDIIALAFGMAIASFLFNYFLNYGIILSSPLYMRIIIVCGIPISFFVNTLQNGFASNWIVSSLRVVGAALIISGFAGFACSKFYESTATEVEKP